MRTLYSLLLLLLTLSMFSCISKKKLAKLKAEYQLLNAGMDSLGQVGTWKERKIRAGDRLAITIKTESLNEAQLQFFDNGKEVEYPVSDEGWIQIPSLGKIPVVGLTRIEVMELIKKKLALVIKDPYVAIRPLNIQVKTLGLFERQGVINLNENDATLSNALLQSGGIQQFARRDSVLVIREENGQRKLYAVDLRNGRALFQSPVYHLMQNDIIVVQPNDYYLKTFRNQENTINIANVTLVNTILSVLLLSIPIINILRR